MAVPQKPCYFSWQRQDETKKEIPWCSQSSAPQAGQAGLVFGCRMGKIQSLPWKQLVPAWHYSVVRENSLTRNPGATLESPSHPLSWDESPFASPHRQVSYSRVTDLWILTAVYSWLRSRETAQGSKQRNCWAFIHSQLGLGSSC